MPKRLKKNPDGAESRGKAPLNRLGKRINYESFQKEKVYVVDLPFIHP